ncbi:MAG: hypothetical protein CMH64_02375 [Nanoarchaeota archaeon]|mgnify:CR=1 FL=1|nr:hypothetical protein [Nanoarchaeota archaeon]|tara:strand:+ start:443 stop:991 length:549 start_codon:yes stop_codon:yes gene_type:complete
MNTILKGVLTSVIVTILVFISIYTVEYSWGRNAVPPIDIISVIFIIVTSLAAGFLFSYFHSLIEDYKGKKNGELKYPKLVYSTLFFNFVFLILFMSGAVSGGGLSLLKMFDFSIFRGQVILNIIALVLAIIGYRKSRKNIPEKPLKKLFLINILLALVLVLGAIITGLFFLAIILAFSSLPF